MKKTLLMMGTILTTSVPIISVIACSDSKENEQKIISTNFGEKYHSYGRENEELLEFNIKNRLNKIFIPDGFEWPKDVTAIEDYAFMYSNLWNDFKIPNTVTKIGEEAFFNVLLPIDFRFPNSLKKIDDEAFTSTVFPKGFYIQNSLSDIELGSGAFENATFPPGFHMPYDLFEKVNSWPKGDKHNRNPFFDTKIVVSYDEDGRTPLETKPYLYSEEFNENSKQV